MKSEADVSTEVLSGPQLDERKKLKATLKKDSEESRSQYIKERRDILSTRTTDTLTVHVGNFKGELTFDYWFDDKNFNFESVQYRITRLNGQSGGNKANVNLYLCNEPSDWWHNSPDSMWQDGQWHNYPNARASLRDWGWITVVVRFIFDKSGDDPSGGVLKQYVRG
jgi:hypothetical protein